MDVRSWQERIEEYEDADREHRYSMFKLGLVVDRETGRERGCVLKSAKLKAKHEARLAASALELTEIKKEIEQEVALHPVYANFLVHIRGIGPIMSYRILGSIGQVRTFENVSQVWRSAGIGIKDGQPQGGQKRGRKKFGGYRLLNQALGITANFLIRQSEERSWYRHYYLGQRRRYGCSSCGHERSKHKEEGCGTCSCRTYRETEETRSHVRPHSGAILDMKRVLISHIYACWRESEGLSVPPSYAAAFKGHYDIPWRDALIYDRDAEPAGVIAAS